MAIETAGPFGPKIFLFLRELGCRLKQVTGEAKSFSYVPVATPVRRCPTGQCRCSDGNNGGTTSSVDFFSWLPFLLWGALSASPLTIWLFLCVFHVLYITNINEAPIEEIFLNDRYALWCKIFTKRLQQMVAKLIVITHEFTELGWWIETEHKSAKSAPPILWLLHWLLLAITNQYKKPGT